MDKQSDIQANTQKANSKTLNLGLRQSTNC